MDHNLCKNAGNAPWEKKKMTENLTPEEIQEAETIQTEIDQIAQSIEQGERTVASSRVKLGSRVHKVRSKKYWRVYGQKSFGAYVASLEPKVKKKRTQVYLCVSVVETLGTQIPEEQLEEMGISRAYQLKKFAKQSGKLVPQALIDAALDREKDVDQLQAEVAAELHQVPETKGKWFELGGFFVTDEEKILLEDTVEITKNLDPPVAHDLPEHEQIKQVVLRWVMEFRGTYGGGE